MHQGSLNGYDRLQQRWVGAGDLEKPKMDCCVYQENSYETQLDVWVKLGVAHGGNLLYLSQFRLMDKPNAMLVGVDIHTSKAADLRILGLQLIQGNCLDPHTFQRVSALCGGARWSLRTATTTRMSCKNSHCTPHRFTWVATISWRQYFRSNGLEYSKRRTC